MPIQQQLLPYKPVVYFTFPTAYYTFANIILNRRDLHLQRDIRKHKGKRKPTYTVLAFICISVVECGCCVCVYQSGRLLCERRAISNIPGSDDCVVCEKKEKKKQKKKETEFVYG